MKSVCHIYGQLDQTGDRYTEELKYLLDLGLTCDTSVGFVQAAKNRASLLELQKAGGLVAPNIYPATLDPACVDSNWWKYSEEQCIDLLLKTKARFEKVGLGPLVAVNTYTPGNTFVAACRKLGIRYIIGFCAPTIIEDGGWEAAHYGSPLSPYFISAEDYRKPENPGHRDDPVLMASMELRNPMVCLNHWSEGPWCPLNAQAADRYLEPTGDPLPFLQIAEDWLCQTELTGRPLFFQLNLQYFFAGRCYEHNRRALEWLAEQRDKGRLEVVGLSAWVERLKDGGGFQRQTTYWRGEMMGFHVGHRPGCFPDVIVDEDLDAQRVWQKPDPLPRRFYNYQKTWNYPAFEPDGTAPASDDFSALKVRVKDGSSAELERIREIEIDNRGVSRQVSLAIWEALEGWEGPFVAETLSEGWTVRVAPHPAGVGGAVLLEGFAEAGLTHLKLHVKGAKLSNKVHQKSWGNLVVAQTFFRHGRPYTMLAAQTPEPFVLAAKIRRNVHDKEPIVAEHLCGLDYGSQILSEDEVALRFDGTRLACWHRIWGVSADQIDLFGVEEVEARLRRQMTDLIARIGTKIEISEPGFQLFGNIRDKTRWDRTLARTVGDAEIARMNEWFRKQRPGVGETVIEVHPGIYMPRGSITKVLGHEFDVEKCADGYGFKELCADYPQGWDWGVSAWVQWRHLRVRIDGLNQKEGTHLLHLHACDPEARTICQRIHFFNPQETPVAPLFEHIPIHERAELCAVKEWVLPRGVEAREHASALCSILIPEECKRWPSLGVWIVPLEKSHLYDWVADRGAPGLFCHLWVTRETSIRPRG